MEIRKMMLLQGGGRKGTMRLRQGNGAMNASVTIPDLQDGKAYPVFVFYNEDSFDRIGYLKNGEMQAFFSAKGPVKAAGVLDSSGAPMLVMTGEAEDFNWDHAKSVLYLKSLAPSKQAGVQEIKSSSPQEEKPFNDVYPLTDDDEAPELLNAIDRKSRYADDPCYAAGEMPTGPQEAFNVPQQNEMPPVNDFIQEEAQEEQPGINEENDLIERARQAFEEPMEKMCEQCPVHAKKTAVYPFSRQYNEYEWEKTEYPGLKGYWHYITGRLYINGVLQKIAIGVPGDYAINPPSWLYGFDTYAFADDGEARGYWILFEDA